MHDPSHRSRITTSGVHYSSDNSTAHRQLFLTYIYIYIINYYILYKLNSLNINASLRTKCFWFWIYKKKKKKMCVCGGGGGGVGSHVIVHVLKFKIVRVFKCNVNSPWTRELGQRWRWADLLRGGGGTFKGRLKMSRFTIKHHDDQTLSFLQIYNTELHLDVYIYTLFSVLCNDSSF